MHAVAVRGGGVKVAANPVHHVHHEEVFEEDRKRCAEAAVPFGSPSEEGACGDGDEAAEHYADQSCDPIVHAPGMRRRPGRLPAAT
jgi:hypothetical protein